MRRLHDRRPGRRALLQLLAGGAALTACRAGPSNMS